MEKNTKALRNYLAASRRLRRTLDDLKNYPPTDYYPTLMTKRKELLLKANELLVCMKILRVNAL